MGRLPDAIASGNHRPTVPRAKKGREDASTESRRMSFTDASVPTSAAGAGAQYIIRGQRGALIGEPSDAVVVQFGVEGPGLTVSGASIKLAA